MKKLILLLFFPCLIFGQAPVRFDHLNVEDGLSQGHVNDLIRDSEGFVWIATQDGLNRYDGYTFRHYHHNPGDPASLSNNYVWCLLEGSNDYLWAGTFGRGLCRLDRQTETFRTFYPRPLADSTVAENSIRSLCEFPAGTLWVGADRGLWKFDLSGESFATPGEEDHWNSTALVTALQPVREDRLLAGTGDGLLYLHLNSGVTDTLHFEGQPIPAVASIVRGAGNEFWAGGAEGLYQVRHWPDHDSLTVLRHFQNKAGETNSLFNGPVNRLLLDENDVLWIGGNGGLSRLDTRDLESGFTLYTQDDASSAALSSNMVVSLAAIEPGLLWAGTREGINRFSNLPSPFHHLSFNRLELCTDAVLGMTEDEQDNLWVATRGGLVRIGRFSRPSEQWTFECLHPSNTPTMPHDYVLRVIDTGEGNLWVAFRRNGFARLLQKSGGEWFFDQPAEPNRLLGKLGANDLLTDRRGVTWIASPGAGLFKWNKRSGRTTVYTTSDEDPKALKHEYVFCLLEDSSGNLWLGTANGGLCRMNPSEGNFDCYVNHPEDSTSLSNNMVLSIAEDSRRRLWVCTANGLNLMEKEGSFRRFFKKDGLPNEVVYGLLEDGEGRLWVSTNRGISRITYREGRLLTHNFDAGDGLQGDEFNQHAFYKTRDGRLCFGGPNGLSIFDPTRIQPYPHPPPVALTDFQLFNQSVPVGSNTATGRRSFTLDESINQTEEIVLRHNQNFVAFELAALGFTQPENNRYAYKMEGLDPAWIFSGTRRFASYPNLPPGNYTFLAKAANHDGVWNDQPKSVRLRVLPPWWRSWWAYLLYLVAVTGVVAAVVRQREASIRRIERAKAEERERFRKRTARDFHDEAGNKITKIALLTEVIKRQPGQPAAMPPLLSQIEANVQALRTGMRDFIWVLDPDNDNLYDTLLRIVEFGNELFEHTPIHFRTEGLSKDLHSVMLNGNQRRHLLLIFKEAMNNCVKYSGARTSVFSVTHRSEAITLSLADDGRGFDRSRTSGNGLRNMRERAEKMNASFDITAAEKNGAAVSVRFRIPQMGN